MSNYFLRKNKTVLLSLGFSSGLPFALVSSTLQAWMTVENIDLKTIGFFSLVGQAYVLKFFWSPFIDRYTIPYFGRRQGWLLISQLLLIIGIVSMSFVEPSKNLKLLATLAVVVAFFSSSQDIIFDAWKTDVLLPEERGGGASISVLGYRLAMLVSGGFALWLADRYLGWKITYRLMAVLMIPGVITTILYAKDENNKLFKPNNLVQAIVDPMRDFFSRNNAFLIVSLIILYKLGDSFANSLTTAFLIRGIGFDAGEVGLMHKTLGLVAIFIGTIYGSIIIKKFTSFQTLMIFGILQLISNFCYCMLSITNKHLYSMACAVFVENLCGSMGTAAFVTLLMTLCNRSFSATQFALLSALSAVGRVYIGMTAGWLVEIWGWPKFYVFSVIITLPGLLLLISCKDTLKFSQNNNFVPRTEYKTGYKWALRFFILGCVFMIIWLFTLFFNYLFALNMHTLLLSLFLIGISLVLCGIIIGSTLDYFAIKQISSNNIK